MKLSLFTSSALAALALAGCEKSPAPAASEIEQEHPVVHVPPVQTRPFEDGYNAGFEYGAKHATPHGAVPKEEEANRVAREQAAGQPDRWERGFAEGYTDGVRNVVTGQK